MEETDTKPTRFNRMRVAALCIVGTLLIGALCYGAYRFIGVPIVHAVAYAWRAITTLFGTADPNLRLIVVVVLILGIVFAASRRSGGASTDEPQQSPEAFMLHVVGENFRPTSIIQVNMSPVATTFVAPTHLTAYIRREMIISNRDGVPSMIISVKR